MWSAYSRTPLRNVLTSSIPGGHMPSSTLRDLYQSELLDLYSAEQQIIGAMPGMVAAVKSPDLKQALDRHLERTRVHVERLDFLFKQSGITAGSAQLSGIESVLRAGSVRIREASDPDVRDAAIISAAQHVEHYEMAGYGCARTFARQLDEDQAADLLQQTLDEEGAADQQLTRLAEWGINQAAVAGPTGETRPEKRSPRLRYVAVEI